MGLDQLLNQISCLNRYEVRLAKERFFWTKKRARKEYSNFCFPPEFDSVLWDLWPRTWDDSLEFSSHGVAAFLYLPRDAHAYYLLTGPLRAAGIKEL